MRVPGALCPSRVQHEGTDAPERQAETPPDAAFRRNQLTLAAGLMLAGCNVAGLWAQSGLYIASRICEWKLLSLLELSAGNPVLGGVVPSR